MSGVNQQKRERQLKATRLKEKHLDRLLIAGAEMIDKNTSPHDGLMYLAAKFVMTTMPQKGPDPGQRLRQLVRKNGNHTLTLTALADDIDLPFGPFPRLILIYICTEAVKAKSRVISFGRSFTDFLRRVGVINDNERLSSYQIKAVKDQLERLVNVGIHLGVVNDDNKSAAILTVAETYTLWDSNSADSGTMILSENFFKVICRSPVPYDRRAILALKHSPMDLDVMLWASYRVAKIAFDIKTRPMSYESLRDQFGTRCEDVRFFKRNLLASLERVKVLWPELTYTDQGKALILWLSPPMVKTGAKKNRKIVNAARAIHAASQLGDEGSSIAERPENGNNPFIPVIGNDPFGFDGIDSLFDP